MKKLLTLLLVASCVLPAFAQDGADVRTRGSGGDQTNPQGGRTVTGKVVDAKGEPVIGASVTILDRSSKAPLTGGFTDDQGNYSVQVTTDLPITLRISYVGFQTQEFFSENAPKIIVLNDDTGLTTPDVIVTAAGIERDVNTLGYSVGRVDGARLAQKAEPDLIRSLSGKVAGVNIVSSGATVGSSTRITIRGNKSFFGNNQPLYVIDGVPVDNSNNVTTDPNSAAAAPTYSGRDIDIDPNNVENMTILKGASAAVLYGTRAANGVIVITTKSGSRRNLSRGFEAQYSTTYTAENIINIPKYQNTYGQGSNGTVGFNNGSWGAPYSKVSQYPGIFPEYAALPQFQGATTFPYQAQNNNVKNFFQVGNVWDNSIRLTGSNGNSSLTSVISQANQSGVVPNNTFQRTNLSLGGNTKITDKLTLNANFAYTHTLNNTPFITGGNGTASLANRLFFLPRSFPLQALPFEDANHKSLFALTSGQSDNPYWTVNNTNGRSEVNRLVASYGLSYDVLSWLNIAYRGGLDTYHDNRVEYVKPGSIAANALGQITKDDYYWQQIESNLLVTVTKDFNDFSFRAIVGNNINQRTSNNTTVQGNQYIAFDVDKLTNTKVILAPTDYYFRRRLIAVFADVSLSYKNWATLNVTGRNDFSSTLPANNRSYFYPAVSASVDIARIAQLDENTFKSIRLRAAYAQVGNDASPYQTKGFYYSNNTIGFVGGYNQFPFNNGTNTVNGASVNTTQYDPNLKPERTKEYEFGTYAELFNSRIILDLTYYNRTTSDQIAALRYPVSTGINNLLTNFGSVRNKGWEIGLTGVPIKTGSGFEWSIQANLTRNRNTVVSVNNGATEIQLGTGGAAPVTTVLRPGEPYGQFRGDYFLRDAQGNYLINPANGIPLVSTDTKVLANPNPDYILGVTNSFSYKRFRLSFLVDYRKGGAIASATLNSMLSRGVLESSADNRDIPRVVPGVLGDATTGKAIVGADGKEIANTKTVLLNDLYSGSARGFALNAPAEAQIWDGTVVRLREVQLTYSFPQEWLPKNAIKAIALSFTARNLFYYAPNVPKGSRFDPEVNSTGAYSNQIGLEYGGGFSTRRLGGSLTVTF